MSRPAPAPSRSPAATSVALDPLRVAHARERLPSADDAARLSALLAVMADPVRLRILYALDVSEELCVGDLARALGANEDQVSYALRLLRASGLVVGRRNGRVVYNRLVEDFPEPLREHCLRQLIAITRRVAGSPVDRRADGRSGVTVRSGPSASTT